jgi:protein-S-isoprenylcysteine O-methyltransferase Ste14
VTVLISIIDLWFIFVGYIVMVAFFVVQRLLRQTEEAKSFKRGAFDKGSEVLIGSVTGIGLLLPLTLNFLGVGVLSISLAEGIVALAVMVLALGLRVWAAVTLGRFYTRTLKITESHRVVTTGPYARIRHPGYLGYMLMWVAFGVLLGNLVTIFLIPIMFVPVYLYRISVEERMLVKELGDEYVQYQKRTRRLVPFVF